MRVTRWAAESISRRDGGGVVALTDFSKKSGLIWIL